MKTAKSNGINITYEVHGRGDPVLFIHGFPLSRELWRPMIEPMSDRFTLIMPDLRGMGDSEATCDASMADYSDDLAALLEVIGEKRPAAVVGLSMGGYVAFEFYRRHRDRVRALVLADTRAEADTPESAKTRLETAEKVMREGSGVVADAMAAKLFARSASPALVEEWRAIMTATKPMGVAAALKAMASRPDSTPTLKDIVVPTLIVVGEEDAITPPPLSRAMHAGIAGSRIRMIPECGHMPPVERPDAFSRAVGELLG